MKSLHQSSLKAFLGLLIFTLHFSFSGCSAPQVQKVHNDSSLVANMSIVFEIQNADIDYVIDWHTAVSMVNTTSWSLQKVIPSLACTSIDSFFMNSQQSYFCLTQASANQQVFSQVNSQYNQAIQSWPCTNCLGGYMFNDIYVTLLRNSSGPDNYFYILDTKSSNKGPVIAHFQTGGKTIYSYTIANNIFVGSYVPFATGATQYYFYDINTMSLAAVINSTKLGDVDSGTYILLNNSKIALQTVYFSQTDFSHIMIRVILPAQKQIGSSYNFTLTPDSGGNVQINDTHFILCENDNGTFWLNLYYVDANFQLVKSRSLKTSNYLTKHFQNSNRLHVTFEDNSYFVLDAPTWTIVDVFTPFYPVTLNNGSIVYYFGGGYIVFNPLDSSYYYNPIKLQSFYKTYDNFDVVWGMYTPNADTKGLAQNCVILKITKSNSTIETFSQASCPCDTTTYPKLTLFDVAQGTNGKLNYTYSCSNNAFFVSVNQNTTIIKNALSPSSTSESIILANYTNQTIQVFTSDTYLGPTLTSVTYSIDSGVKKNQTDLFRGYLTISIRKINNGYAIFSIGNTYNQTSTVVVYSSSSNSYVYQLSLKKVVFSNPLLIGAAVIPLGVNLNSSTIISAFAVSTADMGARFYVYNTAGEVTWVTTATTYYKFGLSEGVGPNSFALSQYGDYQCTVQTRYLFNVTSYGITGESEEKSDEDGLILF